MSDDPNAFELDALLCDSVVVADGKLFIQGGGWDTLNTARLPFRVARVGLAVVLKVPYSRTNENHVLAIKMVGDDSDEPMPLGPQVEGTDGSPQFPRVVQAQFVAGRPPTLLKGQSQSISMAMNFDNMQFDAAGQYTFVLSIEDETLKRLTFRVLAALGMNVR
jgi:hypothetical protein